jgi:hypothetical protein
MHHVDVKKLYKILGGGDKGHLGDTNTGGIIILKRI